MRLCGSVVATYTVPDHKVLAKGTLNDILSQVSLWNGIPKEDLLARLA